VNNAFNMLTQFLKPQATDGTVMIWAKEILVALIIIAIFLFLSRLVSKILLRWGKRVTFFTKTELDDRILKRSIPHISRILNATGLYLAIHSLSLHEKAITVLSGILYVLLVMIIFNLIYHAFDEFMQWYISSRSDDGFVLVSKHMAPVAAKLVMLLLIGTALVIIFKHFNYDIFSLVTALGIGSLAVGMAAKDTLAHMISGFTLMLDRPFQIGDRVKLSNGQIGDVMDIGLRSTKILGIDSTMMIIPNSDLCNSAVVNLARPSSMIQGKVNIGVAYDSDIEAVKRVLIQIASADEEVVAEPPPVALFTSFGDHALDLLLLFWINNPLLVGVVTDRINSAILRRFREEGIGIPYPTRTVIMEKGTIKDA